MVYYKGNIHDSKIVYNMIDSIRDFSYILTDSAYDTLDIYDYIFEKAVGTILHSDKQILAYTFVYGLIIFVISVITILIGVLIGARSGKLQRRANEIWNNTKKK